MFSIEIRDQLLSNLKVLYGDNVEILTIYIETGTVSGHQAIAATSHSPKVTWTKFLHSPVATETQYALRGLLLESEKELAKLLASDGNRVPFDGEMKQILACGRGQPEVPGSSVSQQSEFVFVDAPGSSLHDLHTDKEGAATLDSPVDEVHSKEPVCEEPRYEEPRYEEPAEAPAHEEPVYEEPVYVCQAIAIEEPRPISADDGWGFSTSKKGKKKGMKVCKEVEVEAIEEPQPVLDEDNGWGFSTSKKGKKKGMKVCKEVEVEAIEEPQPVLDEDNGWGFSTSKKGKKKGMKVCKEVEVEAIEEPQPVLDEDNGWGFSTSKKGKKKGIKVFEDVEVEAIEEPEPIPADDGWGSYKPKKGKKKGMKVFEEVEVEVEVIEEPQPIPEEDFGWGSFVPKGKKGKKGMRVFEEVKVIEEFIPEPAVGVQVMEESTPEPAVEVQVMEELTPEPAVEVQVMEESTPPPPEPESEPEPVCDAPPEAVVEDFWSTWGLSSKKDKKGKKKVRGVFEEIEIIEELAPEPAPEPEIESVCDPEPEPEAVPEIEDIKELAPEPEPVPSPACDPPPEAVVEDDWSTWGWSSKKDKKGKKKVRRVSEEEPAAVEEIEDIKESEPEPAPSPDCDPDPKPEPEPELAVEQDPWLAWRMSLRKDNKEEMRSTAVPSDEAGAQKVQEESETGSENPQLEGIPTPTTAPRSGQTVVFTIRHVHSNHINTTKTRTLEAMLFLTDTTYPAICGAVYAYLDSSQDESAGVDVLPLRSKRGKRTLRIRSGIGRNGEVDLSGVEESLWPVYVEYFCRYTKLPELTVEVLDL